MIVMAMIGGTEESGDCAYKSLVRELGASRVRKLYLGYLSDPHERARRLYIELSGRFSDDIVTLVVGSNTPEEVSALRKMGAFICHQYGALTSCYASLAIQPSDLMVTTALCRPEHVLTPIEAWSVCFVKKKEQRRKRREQSKRNIA